jgi:hypothetical protein
MTAAITDLLTQIEAPGAFDAIARAADGLEVEVTCVGSLNFPDHSANSPEAARRRASFALWIARTDAARPERAQHLGGCPEPGEEVAASRVKIVARRWNPLLATYLRALQTDLGLPDECQLEAVFHKLLLYEEGQFLAVP